MDQRAEAARRPHRAGAVPCQAHGRATGKPAAGLAGLRRALQDPIDRAGGTGAGQRQRLVRRGEQDLALRGRHPVPVRSRLRKRAHDQAVALRPGEVQHPSGLYRRLRLQGQQHLRLLCRARRAVWRGCAGAPGQRPLRAVPERHQAPPVRHPLPTGGRQERPRLPHLPRRHERRRRRARQLQRLGGGGGRHRRAVDLLHAAERPGGHRLSFARRGGRLDARLRYPADHGRDRDDGRRDRWPAGRRRHRPASSQRPALGHEEHPGRGPGRCPAPARDPRQGRCPRGLEGPRRTQEALRRGRPGQLVWGRLRHLPEGLRHRRRGADGEHRVQRRRAHQPAPHRHRDRYRDVHLAGASWSATSSAVRRTR